jgi:predicted RNA methylase
VTAQLSIDVAGPEPDRTASQWFTPPALAQRMAAWVRPALFDAAQRAYTLRILEPSAGCGHIVQALRALSPGAQIDACELDPRWAEHLRMLACCTVHEGDYLARAAPQRRYNLAVSNPPYDGGEEADHVAKILDESERAILHLPVRSLHGRARWAAIWNRFARTERDGGGWWIRREARLIARPKYGKDAGSDEIVILDCRRVPGPCDLEWW